jgi:cytidine deaminase
LFIVCSQTFARPAVSNFHVGAAALLESGAVQLGVNIEFGVTGAINDSIHGEQVLLGFFCFCLSFFFFVSKQPRSQCTLTPVLQRGERTCELYISHMPCGHCRQFLNEMARGGQLRVHVGGKSWTLDELLPVSFKPTDIEGGFAIGDRAPLPRAAVLVHKPEGLSVAADALVEAAVEAALRSHTPHTGHRSGVALRAGAETPVYQGAYLENAAFNPSMMPLQAALAAFVGVCGRESFASVSEVVLAHEVGARAVVFDVVGPTARLLEAIAPGAKLTVVTFVAA